MRGRNEDRQIDTQGHYEHDEVGGNKGTEKHSLVQNNMDGWMAGCTVAATLA